MPEDDVQFDVDVEGDGRPSFASSEVSQGPPSQASAVLSPAPAVVPFRNWTNSEARI